MIELLKDLLSLGSKKMNDGRRGIDMAYIKTVTTNSLKRPVFCVNDSIDDLDISNIRKIFNEAKYLCGQYIVSILSDKLTDEDYKNLDDCINLELSADDKFFKI